MSVEPGPQTGLDLTLAIAGIIGAIMVLGTVLLAYAGREIPSILNTGDLAVIGFFFTKGVVQTVTAVVTKAREPKDGATP